MSSGHWHQVEALFPDHEHDEFTELFWTRIQDWCGIRDNNPPRQCVNRVHNLRWVCGNCGKVSVNAELLCEPQELHLEA